ncbi:hypothetical protein EJ08DRAFT_658105 [Tothia fuscella]|uniref:Uncharacterized protein n=1 Tax=Tothia fuscella TaxID=1048955 RepID=A0A9P4NYU2_9PEZI|nr:hypothetical protein EJ08DRAFT_658105 [Tothia fuscella]
MEESRQYVTVNGVRTTEPTFSLPSPSFRNRAVQRGGYITITADLGAFQRDLDAAAAPPPSMQRSENVPSPFAPSSSELRELRDLREERLSRYLAHSLPLRRVNTREAEILPAYEPPRNTPTDAPPAYTERNDVSPRSSTEQSILPNVRQDRVEMGGGPVMAAAPGLQGVRASPRVYAPARVSTSHVVQRNPGRPGPVHFGSDMGSYRLMTELLRRDLEANDTVPVPLPNDIISPRRGQGVPDPDTRQRVNEILQRISSEDNDADAFAAASALCAFRRQHFITRGREERLPARGFAESLREEDATMSEGEMWQLGRYLLRHEGEVSGETEGEDEEGKEKGEEGKGKVLRQEVQECEPVQLGDDDCDNEERLFPKPKVWGGRKAKKQQGRRRRRNKKQQLFHHHLHGQEVNISGKQHLAVDNESEEDDMFRPCTIHEVDDQLLVLRLYDIRHIRGCACKKPKHHSWGYSVQASRRVRRYRLEQQTKHIRAEKRWNQDEEDEYGFYGGEDLNNGGGPSGGNGPNDGPSSGASGGFRLLVMVEVFAGVARSRSHSWIT